MAVWDTTNDQISASCPQILDLTIFQDYKILQNFGRTQC